MNQTFIGALKSLWCKHTFTTIAEAPANGAVSLEFKDGKAEVPLTTVLEASQGVTIVFKWCEKCHALDISRITRNLQQERADNNRIASNKQAAFLDGFKAAVNGRLDFYTEPDKDAGRVYGNAQVGLARHTAKAMYPCE